MSNFFVILLCGLPGAGKTFFAKTLKQKLTEWNFSEFDFHSSQEQEQCYQKLSLDEAGNRKEQHKLPTTVKGNNTVENFHIMCLHYDKLLPQNLYQNWKGQCLLEQEEQNLSWKDYRRNIVHLVDILLRRLSNVDHSEFNVSDFQEHEGCHLMDTQDLCRCYKENHNEVFGHIVIVDDNMFYRSMRYEYYQLARKYTTGFCQIYLQCSLETAFKRNLDRDATVSEETFSKMSKKLEPPDNNKNDWEKNTIFVDSELTITESILNDIIVKILDCCNHPVEPLPSENLDEKEESRQICLQSLLHQSDNVLRKIVSREIQQMKGLSTVDKKELSRRATDLNKSKKMFLDHLKYSSDLQENLSMFMNPIVEKIHERKTVQANQVAFGIQEKPREVVISDFEIAVQESFKAFSKGKVVESQ